MEKSSAQQVAANDARLETGTLEYGGLRCYVARPANWARPLPALLALHETRGRDAYIEEVARRAALEGCNAVVAQFDEPSDRHDLIASLLAVIDDLASRAQTRRVGALGFGWGGGMANHLAVHSARLAAVVSFYGAVPDVIDVPRIKARLLLHYAERDCGVNTGVPAYEGALKAAGIQHAIHMYPGTDHGFHNHTLGERYDKDAAELAWRRTMDFLKDALR